jgi:signal transduction histidine kinase
VQLSKLVRSATFRLSALYAALFAASVVALGGAVFVITRDALEGQMSARIEAEIVFLRSEYRLGGTPRVKSAIEERQNGRPFSSLDYGLLDSSGQSLAGDLRSAPRIVGWHDVVGPGDGDEPEGEKEYERLRVEALAPGLWLVVGDDLERVEGAGEAILVAFGWALGLMVVLAVGGGLILAHGFLSRIDGMTRTAEAIIAGNMNKRIPLRGTSDDLDRLASTFNRMLDRIAGLMESLKQVSNDIAHDLRTPLARLRQGLERVRGRDASLDEFKLAVDRALAETESSLEMFSALLRIAQIEAGTRRAKFRDVDLSAAVETVAEAFAPSAEDEQKVINRNIMPHLRVGGDKDLLMQMVANLIENAIRHTQPGTHIDVVVEKGERGPNLVVADNGAGVPEGERIKVMQRFYRLERNRTTPGTGLGLSLVAAIADLHGAKVKLRDNEPGLKVVVEFGWQEQAHLEFPRPV